jgi:hypothetical protein
MWYYNRLVQYVYIPDSPQAVFAIVDGVSGWKRVKPGAADGVTNVGTLLNAARANNRKVHVDIVGDEITGVILL